MLTLKTVFVLITARLIVAELYEGDTCFLDINHSEVGICRLLDQCPYAIDLLKNHRIPSQCGFEGHTPIVCCKESPGISNNLPVVNDEFKKKCASFEYKADTEEEKKKENISFIFVAGGKKAKAGEFPHMAALGYGDKENVEYLCGGSLISKQFVLSAAHCLNSRDRGPVRWVLLGALNLNDSVKRGATIHEVIETYQHPNYRPPSNYHDIALLKLKNEVPITKGVAPACLYERKELLSSTVFPLVATGWGSTSYGSDQSNILMKVELKHVQHDKCRKSYSSFSKGRLANGIMDDIQVCAGDEVGKDTCRGDSGGPLQVRTSIIPLQYSIVGITSIGKICAITPSPGVYTRISGYIPWIESIVWPA